MKDWNTTASNARGNSLIMVLAGMAITSVVVAGVYQAIGSSLQLHRGIVARYDYDDALEELKVLLRKTDNCEGLFKNVDVNVDKKMFSKPQPIDLLNKTLPDSKEKFTDMNFGSIHFDRKAEIKVLDAAGNFATAQIVLKPITRGDAVPMRPRPMFVGMTMKGKKVDSCAVEMEDSANDGIELSYLGKLGDPGFVIPPLKPGEYFTFGITIFNVVAPGSRTYRLGEDSGGGSRTETYSKAMYLHLTSPGKGHIPLTDANRVKMITGKEYVPDLNEDYSLCTLSGGSGFTTCGFGGSLPTGFTGRLQPRVHSRSGPATIGLDGRYKLGSYVTDPLPYLITVTKHKINLLSSENKLE
jgi:hypothetical protein